MNELWLRELMDRAVADEPPMGPVPVNSLRAGIKQRRRRRAQGAVACLGAAALIGTAAVAATGTAGNLAAGPAKMTGPSTVYVLSGEGNLYAIANATRVRGKRIQLPGGRQFMAITPNGKTIYVSGDEPNAVIPVSTVTDTAGKPIQFGRQVPTQILITPNGKTAYVTGLSGGEIYPIATATNTMEKPINAGQGFGGLYQMALTPDGKTLYVVSSKPGGTGPSYVIPISTATNTPGKPIKIQSADVGEIVVNPDGTAVYAIGGSPTGTDIIPISTATNTPGKPSNLGEAAGALAITPGGQNLYLVRNGVTSGPSGVIPFSAATNTAGKLIKVNGMVSAIAVTPDGNTAYAASEPRQNPAVVNCTGRTGEVTPISTVTNLPGRPIRVACDPYALAVTPDGKTVWVGSRNWVTPISTATNTAGQPIKFRGAFVAMVVALSP
ncbi:MAG TPA: YncE family protein [Trebonia sp.]|jgi:DNA-binding beta-propeller fold protein YncE|nr:YncE family protein [Trebonia sp.]